MERAEDASGMVAPRAPGRHLRLQRLGGASATAAGLVLLVAALWLSEPPGRPTLRAATVGSSTRSTPTSPMVSTAPAASPAPVRLPVSSTTPATTAAMPPTTKAPASFALGPVASNSTVPETTSPPTTRRAPTSVLLAEADNGRTISLQTGDSVEVDLAVCSTCGDKWLLSEVPSPQVVRYNGETDHPSAPGPGGAPAKQQAFSFSIVSDHTTSLGIGYYPAGASQPSREYHLTLAATPSVPS